MSTTTAKMHEQLGMPYPTAMHRLRKQLLFSLVLKLELDVCFVCGQQIQTVEELSIEHREPWLDNNPDLFWDLDNITFSHLPCNKQHRRRGGRSHQCSIGFAWCSGHQECLPVEEFSLRSETGHQDGQTRAHCKECRSRKRGK